MQLYSYSGPVMLFDRCVCNCWKGRTLAVSEKEAKTNLTYRYKSENGLQANTKISLPGKIEVDI